MARRPSLSKSRWTAAAALALTLGGCYSGRTVWGGVQMLAARRPVERLLADPATPADLARWLRSARSIVEFAAEELSLPVGRSYSSYVELDRPYATWTVTAAPELAVEPLTWCFPIAGCVSYRGYFKEATARRFAERQERRGLDVDVGGVRAFSSLGWFRDPLLSSFLDQADADLAGLLIHELAHRRLYVQDDTPFNESFASVVEEEGVRRWLEQAGRGEELSGWIASRRRDEAVTELALATRERLAEAYAASQPEAWKREKKAKLLAELRAAYQARRSEWGDRWDRFFDAGLNNARLASLSAYAELVPGFRRLFSAANGDFERFYAAAESLAGLPPNERRARLSNAGIPPAAQRRVVVLKGPEHPRRGLKRSAPIQ